MRLKLVLKLFIFILLVSSIAKTSYSQNKGDSLQSIYSNVKELDSIRFKALKEYHDIFSYSQPDSALFSIDYHYNLAKEKKATREMFRALNRRGNIYRLKGDFTKSLESYNRAGELAIQLENPILQATITGNIGNIFLKQQNYQEATQYYSKALKIFQKEKDKKGEGRMLRSLGSVYLTIGNRDLAIEYYNRSLEIAKNSGVENTGTAVNLMNIGLIKFEKELYNEAIIPFEKALKILEIKNEKFFIAGCYKLLAKIYLELNKLEKALVFAEKNLAINKELNIERGTAEALLVIAQITFETNVDEAARQGEAILTLILPETDKDIKKEAYHLLYMCYKAQNKIRLSLEMHEQYTIFNDSIQLEKNNFAVAREAVKNDFEVKLFETKLENEKEQAKLELKQLKITFAITFASALLIALIIIYYSSRIKRNHKKREDLLVEIENLKLNASSNLIVDANKFELVREKIEISIKRKLNETDWTVLNILLDDPVITNKDIAEKAFKSVDGIGSSLRRMYDYFGIKETKYKKISLLLEGIKISNNPILPS
ncbi:tetratricopeptide repeat protein [Brumimicrobium glaciale]|uniref:Tetratricopeptide repeat protein n=1 Tax=Brumimicrobium glaciale TaxID=200475 RepID=A0A4Q4KQT5_9FLAO|nr:tetratricopeptide repeat protein [Brumimicrobium glaciale]RYM34924.1 tetratricopeptide repeat protein [Brumimicrobium glaciale]